MRNTVIRTEKLAKQYHIGVRQNSYRTLRDTLSGTFSSFFRRENSSLNHTNETIWALKDVSFEVERGEIVGIIGRNGAGKTTLLKILSRITVPTEGYAEVHGQVGSLLEVGTGFHPELTGRENIYLNGAILGMKKREIDKKFDEIVAFAEIEKFIDTPVKFYSSGMYVRLAFAVAAYLEPDILLVDEVLAVGDAAFQKKCLGKMGDITKGGRTILFVSHNMSAIRSLCSRAILLSEGKIVFMGSSFDCVEQYLLSVSEDMPAVVDVLGLQRGFTVIDDKTVRISKIKIHARSSQAIIYAEEPMIVDMEFRLFRAVDDMLIGWSIISSDGTRIFQCTTADYYGLMSLHEPGTYTVRCRLPDNPLNPGLYKLEVGARSAQKSLDWIPSTMVFRVDSNKKLSSTWLESPSGLLRVRSEWTKPVRHQNAVS